MVTVPLGVSAYKRTFSGEPEVRLVNRFLETNPTNLREKIALLSRAGTVSLGQFAGGLIRSTYSKVGLFGGDLFIVSGSNLYRLSATTGLVMPVSGTLQNNGNGFVYQAWMKGIGYEYDFFSDGSSVQFYSTRALGVLTVTAGGSNITNQVIDINGVYYSWSATVNSGTPAGTSGAPYLALLGTAVPDANGLTGDASSLANMNALLNFSGVSGFTYSSTLPGASADVTAQSEATTMTVTALVDLSAGNLITTSIFSGANLSWGAATLTGGGNQALQTVTGMGPTEVPGAITPLSGYILVAVAGTTKFYWINPGETIIDPLNFASKESNPDPITGMATIGDQSYVCGGESTENWYATGTFTAPFAPIEGRVYRRGVLAGTETVVKDALMLVGDDGVVYTIGYNWGDTSQYGVHAVSTHGIEERIRTQMRILQGLPA